MSATNLRSVRVEDELWEPARDKAAAEGTDLSTVIRQAIKDFLSIAKRPDMPADQGEAEFLLPFTSHELASILKGALKHRH